MSFFEFLGAGVAQFFWKFWLRSKVQNSYLFTFRYVKWIQSSINYLEVNEQERRSQHATANEDEGKGTFN